MNLPCAMISSEPISEEITIDQCGDVLAGAAGTFSWNDALQTPSTGYSFTIGSVFGGSDIYDMPGGGASTVNSVNVSGLPTDGRTLFKTLIVYRDGPAAGVSEVVRCECTAANEPSVNPVINNCGAVLTSGILNASWTDPGTTPNTIYDFLVGSTAGAGDIYNHQGGGVFNGTSISGIPVPTNGQLIHKTVLVFDGGAGTPVTRMAQCTCTAATIINEDHVLFQTIEDNGLPNGCYPTNDDYVAEYLFQSANDACYWEVDLDRGCIVPVPTPVAPVNAIPLPQSNGTNDTAQLASFLQPGNVYIGTSATYRINNLDLNDANIDIYNFNMIPATGTGEFVRITANNIRLFNSSINGQNQASVYRGITVDNPISGFEIINSSIRNFHHRVGGVGTGNQNGAGILIRGATNYRIACCDIRDLINDTGVTGNLGYQNSSVLAIMRGIWLSGGTNNAPLGDGYIVNTYFENFQSNGSGRDAEAIAIQGHSDSGTGRPRIFGNTGLNTGKRFIKAQDDKHIALSNYYHTSTTTPSIASLGLRAILGHFDAVLAGGISDIVWRNNRTEDSSGRYEYIYSWTTSAGMSDSIIDCNQHVQNVPNTRNTSIPVFLIQGASGNPGVTPVNSTVNNNAVLGPAPVQHIYKYKTAVNVTGALTNGNTWSVAPSISVFA